MGRLDGRVAIITGAAQGIGAAYARGMAAEGASVVIADRDPGAAVVEAITGAGGAAIDVPTDVAIESACFDLVAKTVEAYGRLDILVNNAAIFTAVERKKMEDIPVAEWDRVMAVNVKGYLLAARAVFPYMKERGWGRIINLSSNTALSGVPGILHYVTSKGAALGFTRALAREIGSDGITVNAITPGLTSTEGVKAHYSEEMLESRVTARSIQRIQQPDDLVGAVMFLASDQAGFITGQVLNIDGGQIMY